MFVGISITELLSWYLPVGIHMAYVLGGLAIVVLCLFPLLSLVWAYVDRSEFTNSLLNWACSWLDPVSKFKTHPEEVPKIILVKGKHVYHVDAGRVRDIWVTGESAVIRIHKYSTINYPSDVNSEGYVGAASDCKQVNVTKGMLGIGREGLSTPVHPLMFLAYAILLPIFWPMAVIALSLFVPLYLLRAARDGQKLAVKLAAHISNKEVHSETDSSS